MAWLYLLIAGALEIVWAINLKNVDGISKPVPLLIMFFSMVLSFIFLSMALKNLPIGTAYAVWTGIGAVGVAIYGILFLGESAHFLRILCLFLIIIGIIGLKFIGTVK
ncbi:DMT family transporter [Silvanigrella aquatica]|uniref:Guanidinium exporter n=1 Tax=Silvanigrella aquatica TaxID=1915309 RepID=A0A1L4CX44_9BACT|nr:multidrug efflux SMR transporter [Silvanigrella aquatica]APJ02514.1 QacE family quaternary ammonium compound efflux SMR transporter [Silvanigrella aquatica]